MGTGTKTNLTPFLGLGVVAYVVFLLATTYFVVVGRIRKGREETVWREGHGPSEQPAVEERAQDR